MAKKRTPEQLRADADESADHLAMRAAELRAAEREVSKCIRHIDRARREATEDALKYVATQPHLIAVLEKCRDGYTVTKRTPPKTKAAIRLLARYRLLFTSRPNHWETTIGADWFLSHHDSKDGAK